MSRWETYRQRYFYDEETGLLLDFSGLTQMPLLEDKMPAVFAAMLALEGGAIANQDENRMVGHYWLRCPGLAPTKAIADEIRQAQSDILTFVDRVQREGKIHHVLLIGIGGSSLGPAFLADALSSPGQDRVLMHYMDNTDPDGMDRIFAALSAQWEHTLVLVVSKSGGTIETRNGMEETRKQYEAKGLSFPAHAIAVTMPGSQLDRLSRQENWLKTFPLWDWVGGRTSVLSPVGLLPLALQGVDIEGLLSGAAACDRLTRRQTVRGNPAALLAAAWHAVTKGQGGKEMVVLPYKDRLGLFAKYLQQLVMESLGKEENRAGEKVAQGLTVLGNKGSTDQHSYVQQLLAGPNTFFTVFLEVLTDREGPSPVVGEESTSGDYLQAFLLGTARAMAARGREHLIITIPEIDSYHLGVLLALFERTVGYYAELVNINAYHQPAVEMGKKSANLMIGLKNNLLAFLAAHAGEAFLASELAEKIALPPGLEREEAAYFGFRILWRLAANESGIGVEKGPAPALARFYRLDNA